MKLKYEKELLIEKGQVELTEMERLCILFADCLESRNGKGLLNHKKNGRFDLKGETISFKSRVRITPEIIQDMSVHPYIDAEAELSSLVTENIEAEAFRALSQKIMKQKTSLQSLLLEKLNSDSKLYKINYKRLFNKILNFFNFEYTFVVSAEICYLLDELRDFKIKTKDIEEGMYSMGLEVVGCLEKNGNKVKVLRDPYLPPKNCFVAKNIESAEFFIEFNPTEITNDPNSFMPYYGAHIMHINIPHEIKYQSFEIEGVPNFQ